MMLRAAVRYLATRLKMTPVLALSGYQLAAAAAANGTKLKPGCSRKRRENVNTKFQIKSRRCTHSSGAGKPVRPVSAQLVPKSI